MFFFFEQLLEFVWRLSLFTDLSQTKQSLARCFTAFVAPFSGEWQIEAEKARLK